MTYPHAEMSECLVRPLASLSSFSFSDHGLTSLGIIYIFYLRPTTTQLTTLSFTNQSTYSPLDIGTQCTVGDFDMYLPCWCILKQAPI